MNRRHLAIAAVALAGTLGATLAQAHDRGDVQWSVTIGNPAPSAWVGSPAYVYGAPAWSGGYERSHRGYSHPSRWDRDGDGIPNRYDRRDGRYRGHR